MAITRVQTKNNPISPHLEFGSTGSPSCTYTSTPTQNNLLVASVYGTGVNQVFTAPSGWSTAIQFNGTQFIGGCVIWYKVAGASESTTVTGSMSPSAGGAMTIYEYSGCATSSPLDQTGSAERGASTGSTLSVSTSGATTVTNEIAFTVYNLGGAISTWTWSGGFTSDYDAMEGGEASQILSSTGTVTSTFTWNNNQLATGVVATFKGLAVPVPPRSLVVGQAVNRASNF